MSHFFLHTGILLRSGGISPEACERKIRGPQANRHFGNRCYRLSYASTAYRRFRTHIIKDSIQRSVGWGADTQGWFVVPPSNDVRLVQTARCRIAAPRLWHGSAVQSARGLVAACLIPDSFVRQRTVPAPRPRYLRCRYGTLRANHPALGMLQRSSDFDHEVSKHEENGACAASRLGTSGGGRS